MADEERHAVAQGTHRDLVQEYDALVAELRRKPKCEKVIEATVPGDPEFREIRALPSAFEYYPQIEHEAAALKDKNNLEEAITYLKGLQSFMSTGDVSKACTVCVRNASIKEPGTDEQHFKQLHKRALLFPKKSLIVSDSSEPIDLTQEDEEADEPRALYIWQVSCGDDGWTNFDAEANGVVEAAFNRKETSCSFVGYQGVPYRLNFEFMAQMNEQTGNYRPVRRIKLS